MIFLGLSLVCTLAAVLARSPAVMLTMEFGVCAASTVILGAAWWRERGRGDAVDPLIGIAFVAVLLYTSATAGFAGLPVLLGVELPVPSVVDGMFFLSYVLFGVFLWKLGSRSRGHGRHQYLDTLIVTLGLMPVIGVRLIEPQLAAGSVSTAQVAYLAYPVFVSILLGLTVRLAMRAPRLSTPCVLLGGWIGLELAADLLFVDEGISGTYVYGQPWQALWVLSAGCIGALVLHPRARDLLQVRPSALHRGRGRLYVLGSALTGPMIADSMGERADRLLTVVGVVLIVALCLRLSGLMVDVKEQRRLQQELRQLSGSLAHQNMHDPLTGLANRALLNERLALRPSARADGPTSVLLLDIDDFKLVNDSLGHAVGDLLLMEVAHRILLELRAQDRGGRLGGDEFVVILDNARAAQARALAERLLESLARPMLLGKIEVSVSVSIGIATSSDVREGLNLLGAADMAMYAAKERGKAGIALFEARLHEAADAKLALEIDLRRAVRHEEFFLAYQPIVDLKTGGLAGVEALVRWTDPVRGRVSPEAFIPIAERTGLILPLGAWVLRESVEQMKRWDLQAPQSRLVMNVNISTRQLERPGLLALVDELISHGLDPDRLVLEITETALTVDGRAAAETLHQLRARGLRLAVDDFGTGYSSLSRLQAAPVSQLKIDQSFVNEITDSTCLVPIIHATVAMADGLGLGVIAEGVETTVQLQYLRSLGCRHAQGYLLARPTDAASITAILTGPLPWAALMGAAAADADRQPHDPQMPGSRVGAGLGAGHMRDLQPSDVVRAAQAIAAVAAAEVAADAAVTAQAAVTAACEAALEAAAKAERVAALAADAAAKAARELASVHDHPAATSRTAANRTAVAAASAVMKVAAQVESVAAAAAAAGASAAGLVELQLSADAAVAASALAHHAATPDDQG
jgi:diguanylate cyclase (GGDEF)-like protein